MAKVQAKHGQKRKGHSLWTGVVMWWIVVLASLTMNLIIVIYIGPLYKDGDLRTGKCKAILQEAKKSATSRLVENNKEMGAFALQEISVSLTSGSSPVASDSIINLDHGDPTMFEAFWHRMGDKATIVITGSQTISYFSDVTNICWFLEPEFNQEVRRLHKLVGNAVTEDRYIVVGTGSTQLFQAAVYALSPSDASEPMSVVSSVPYYSSYPMKTDYLRSGLFHWAGDAHAFSGKSYIEVVCSPNNPDGFMNKAVLNSETGKTIHDLAYYWPQYTAITEPADHDVMLFTASKSTGHAGTRVGWAILKDPNVAKKMTKFVEMNTIGVSKDSQLRVAKILKVISDGYELPNVDSSVQLFDYGRRHLAERWERLREIVKDIGIFSLPEYTSETCKFTGEKIATYPAFAWLKCEKEGIEDTEWFLKTLKILSRNGKHFGVEAKYARVSMLDREGTFNLFIERLASLK